MRSIKLLTLTSLNYVLIFTLLTLISFALFFSYFKAGLAQSIDEALSNRKVRILNEIVKNGGRLPVDAFNLTDFRISPSKFGKSQKDVYRDTAILQTGDDETEYVPFRKLSTFFQIGVHLYKLEIVVPIMEREAITDSLTKTLRLVFIITVFVFFISTHILSRSLWRSFYIMLDTVRDFEIDRSADLKLKATRIAEFNTLNQVVIQLTTKARCTFSNQKQFIENASHELQTPLAINQNKLEQLTDDPNLTKNQSDIIHTLINSTQRMARLNKTLLLMSKIENEQFPEIERVWIAPLLNETLTLFEEQRELRHLKIQTDIDESICVYGNRTLLDLLVSNLIKNAFVHNYQKGEIRLSLKGYELTVMNSSKNPEIPGDKLFQRFYKNTGRKESWGLGLAMVYKICILNNWKIRYSKEGIFHSFIVSFNKECLS
jgi:signal transduction histidine kinase